MMGSDKEKGVKTHTIVFMVVVAVFFDVLQFLLGFVYMGWVVGIFAGLTFYVWFKIHGISFMKPKRLLAFGGASIIEIIPIPLLASLPAWTAAVLYLAISNKIKAVVPGAQLIKSAIIKR